MRGVPHIQWILVIVNAWIVNNLSLVNIFGETVRLFYNINYMLNSKHLSLVNKIGDKTEFTITRVHCITWLEPLVTTKTTIYIQVLYVLHKSFFVLVYLVHFLNSAGSLTNHSLDWFIHSFLECHCAEVSRPWLPQST